MALVSLKETYPDYRNTFSDDSLSHLDDYSVYVSEDDKVGTIEDGLFDNATGRFRYLIVDTGVWIFGKKVLLPIGKAEFDTHNRRVYVRGLTKDQVESLPKYEGTADYSHEESVRGVYREASASESIPVEGTAYKQETYDYDRHDADLYTAPAMGDTHQPIRLYEERLIADKNRMKVGDVSVGKRVETETAQVSVPVEKERVVIERTDATGTANMEDRDHAFADGEVAKMEVYEETANVRKEAFVREEVSIHKETEQEMVTEKANIRREELDVNADGATEVVSR